MSRSAAATSACRPTATALLRGAPRAGPMSSSTSRTAWKARSFLSLLSVKPLGTACILLYSAVVVFTSVLSVAKFGGAIAGGGGAANGMPRRRESLSISGRIRGGTNGSNRPLGNSGTPEPGASTWITSWRSRIQSISLKAPRRHVRQHGHAVIDGRREWVGSVDRPRVPCGAFLCSFSRPPHPPPLPFGPA